MSRKEPTFKWKTQTVDKSCETLDCPVYDTYRNFKMEPTGHYALIRVDRQEGVIEVALTTKDHRIIKVFQGKTPQQIYHHIFKMERQENQEWFKDKDHIAYLGKELARAELYLNGAISDYLQE